MDNRKDAEGRKVFRGKAKPRRLNSVRRRITARVSPADSSRASERRLSTNNAASQTLNDIELLFNVLRFLGTAELVWARTVSRTWDVVVDAVRNLEESQHLSTLIRGLGSIESFREPTLTLSNCDLHDTSLKKQVSFGLSSRAIRKLDIDLAILNSVNSPNEVALEMSSPLSVLYNMAPSRGALFANLRDVIVSQDLSSIHPHVFTTMFLPPTIRTLTISNLGQVSIQAVFDNLSLVSPWIEKLSICGDTKAVMGHQSFEAPELGRIPGLRKLELMGLADNWSLIQALAAGCAGLEQLNVEYGTPFRMAELEFEEVTFPRLHSLSFMGCDASRTCKIALFFLHSKFPHLTSLSISFTSESQMKAPCFNQLVENLSHSCGKTLQSLALSFGGTWACEQDLRMLNGLSNLENLEVKFLAGDMTMTDVSFKRLCQGFPGLKSLVIEAENTALTIDALKLYYPDSLQSLTNLSIPISGSISLQDTSYMALPFSLKYLGLKLIGLKERDVAHISALITSVCPANTLVEFVGSPWAAISSLRSTFRDLHAWKKCLEERFASELCKYEVALRERTEMCERMQAERDSAIREQKTLEVMIGDSTVDEF